MTALDQRTWPSGGDGDDGFLHGVEHDGQLVAAAFELGKVLARGARRSGSARLPWRRARRLPVSVEARAQIAVGDAAGESDDALQTAR